MTPESFYDVLHEIASGNGFCYRCGKTFGPNAKIVYATIESSNLTVVFHRVCWEESR